MGVLFFRKECQLINGEGMIELENLHFITFALSVCYPYWVKILIWFQPSIADICCRGRDDLCGENYQTTLDQVIKLDITDNRPKGYCAC